jgi:hypothetical protein
MIQHAWGNCDSTLLFIPQENTQYSMNVWERENYKIYPPYTYIALFLTEKLEK